MQQVSMCVDRVIDHACTAWSTRVVLRGPPRQAPSTASPILRVQRPRALEAGRRDEE